MFRSVVLLAAAVVAGCGGQSEPSATPAKNVIVFIGDGMGVSTITAARIFDGQSRGESGEENVLSFERFPEVALVKTYNSNQQVPDSAGTATAIHTGIKTRAGLINVGPESRRRDCAASVGERLQPIGVRLRESGKALGIVTTTRITHATPATVYANSPERDYESDRFLEPAMQDAGCVDIASQLLAFDEAHGFNIVLGGGAREFRSADVEGERRGWGVDLLSDWASAGEGRLLVDSADELEQLDASARVLGLFSSSHLDYIAERDEQSNQPTIQQMTRVAIDHLEAQGTGYYLLVEGGRIDHGHHDGYPGWALLEAQAFAEAVQIAVDRVDLDETLILVTADHSHVMTIAGYPTRGNPILGHVVGNDDFGEPKTEPKLAVDGQPYTTIGYANSSFPPAPGPRQTPETGINARAQSLYQISYDDLDGSVYMSETHGGEDVPLYAIGPGSECVGGVIEQNRIFDFIAAAVGWQPPPCD